ncbi:50S ribosome-binding GTPase [Candidatus Pacearchaeota archaeon]|nr:50S ribosome-binding GTPase [Candidatus Pacearchaeota archaeon]
MALPPDIQKQKIRKRLTGLEGKARLNEIKKILEELPGYKTGDYGQIRKSLMKEIETTKTRSKIKHQDWLGVSRQGHKQFCLVGAPSAGKSSLLSKLSGMKIKTAEYDFTTLKPIPAVVKLNGAQIQIVDLPGLIEGATEDAGRGKRLIGIVKNTDGILFMIDLAKDYSKAEKVYNELVKANIQKPIIFIGNKIDLPSANENAIKLKNKFKDLILLSTLTGEGIGYLKKEIWEKSNLIRVYTEKTDEPMILKKGSSVEDLVKKIHKNLLEKFKTAIISGPSAKFSNQRVGLNHTLKDNDKVEIVSER